MQVLCTLCRESTTWDGYLCRFILLVATCMSFALICMCCSAGCYCNVHVQVALHVYVQVALHVQVHVLVVCRCSAWSVAYVIRVQLPGILWSLYVYDCRSLLHCLFFVRHCFCPFSFLCVTFIFYIFYFTIVFFFFFFFSSFSFSLQCTILLRVF